MQSHAATPLTTLDALGLGHFRTQRAGVIETVALRLDALEGASSPRSGDLGHEATLEDLAHTLQFVEPVLEFGDVSPMVDYLRWRSSVLSARGIAEAQVALSLDLLDEAYASRLAPSEAAVVSQALREARTQLEAAGPRRNDDAPVPPDAWPESFGFEAQALAGDNAGAIGTVDCLLESGRGLVETELHVVQPAMYRIGQAWQSNKVSVAQEHLATAIARLALARGLLKAVPPPSNGRKVLLACVQGNEHSLGVHMVADAFQLAGWDVQLLGASMPSDALVGHALLWKPDLVGLSLSFAHQLRAAKAFARGVGEAFGVRRPALLVGGLAINRFEGLAQLVGADGWSTDAAAAVLVGSRLVDARALN